jgi:O-antigen ligase
MEIGLKREKITDQFILGTILLIILGLCISRAAISIGTGLLGFLGIISFRKHHFKKIFNHKYLSIIIIYIFFLLSAFITEDFKKYQQLLFFQLPLILIPLFFLSNSISIKNTRIIIWSFTLLIAIICLGTLVDFFTHYAINMERITESKSILSITGIAHYQFALLIIIAIINCFFLLNQQNQFKKLILCLVIFFILTIHILAYRTGLFCFYGLLLFTFFRLLIYSKQKKKLLLITVLVVFVLTMASLFIKPLHLKIQNTREDISRIINQENFNNYSITQRYAATLNAVEIFKNNLWLGVSPADLGKEMDNQYQKNSYLLTPENRIFIHNQYLFYLSSFGLIAFLIWITLWIRNIYTSIKFNLFGGYILLAASIVFLADNFFELQIGFTSVLLFYYLVSQRKFNQANN